MDRTYWNVPGLPTWHALDVQPSGWLRSMCGRFPRLPVPLELERADRVPASGHLCGSCSRVIAARTDIEERAEFKRGELARVADLQEAAVGMYPTIRHDDVPEPVVSEQDDWSPV